MPVDNTLRKIDENEVANILEYNSLYVVHKNNLVVTNHLTSEAVSNTHSQSCLSRRDATSIQYLTDICLREQVLDVRVHYTFGNKLIYRDEKYERKLLLSSNLNQPSSSMQY